MHHHGIRLEHDRPGTGQNLRPVGQTESVPGVLFMAHQRLPARIRDRLQAGMLSWQDSEEGRKILQSLGFGELAPVNVADYQRMPKFGENQ